MLHEPAAPSARDPSSAYKMRLGLWMLLFYSIFYMGFVGLMMLWPQAKGSIVSLGLNLATVYGVVLILMAFVQALIYDAMCRRKEAELARLESLDGEVILPGQEGGG